MEYRKLLFRFPKTTIVGVREVLQCVKYRVMVITVNCYLILHDRLKRHDGNTREYLHRSNGHDPARGICMVRIGPAERMKSMVRERQLNQAKDAKHQAKVKITLFLSFFIEYPPRKPETDRNLQYNRSAH